MMRQPLVREDRKEEEAGQTSDTEIGVKDRCKTIHFIIKIIIIF